MNLIKIPLTAAGATEAADVTEAASVFYSFFFSSHLLFFKLLIRLVLQCNNLKHGVGMNSG